MVQKENRNKNELSVVNSNTTTDNENLRDTVSPDADSFFSKFTSKILSKKKQKIIKKSREKDPVPNIAEGAMPIADVDYNFTELIRFMEIYDLIKNSYINVIDADGNIAETLDTDSFSGREFMFSEYATNTFRFDIETVPVFKLTLPLSRNEMVLVQYKDTLEHDVIFSKNLTKNTKSEFTAFELSDMLEDIKKEGLNLKSFIKEEVGETYAGKSKKGY